MRIVVIGTRGFPNLQGGIEVHCQNLYSHLTNLGCDVTVLAKKAYVGKNPYIYSGIKIVPLMSFRNRYLESILHTFWAVIFARRYNSDILHIHGIGPGVFIPLAKLLGFFVVLTTHGENYMHSSWGPLAKLFLRFSEFIGVMFADRVIAVSQHSANNLIKKYRKYPFFIPNGICRKGNILPGEILSQNNLEKGKYYIYVGRIVQEKGVHDLISAYANLKRKDWKLVIVGGTDHVDHYSKEIIEKVKEIPGIVMMGCMTGYKLEEVFSNAGLFVLPSYYECAPIALLEAMAYGLNCLVSDIAATREFSFPEKNYFQSGNVTDLSLKLVELSNFSFSNQVKLDQLEYIKKEYNWHSIAYKTLDVYYSASNNTHIKGVFPTF